MKKLRCAAVLCFLGVLVMLSAAYAQEAVPPQTTQNHFAMRDGITWDTTVAEMMNIEGAPNPEYTEEDDVFQAYRYENKQVSKYTAGEMAFMFQNGQLIMIGYNLEAVDADDFAYLMQAISTKYGSPIEEDFRRCIDLMNALSEYPVSYEAYLEYASEIEFLNWELDDGTYIILLFEDDEVVILYFNEARILESDTIHINGL